MNEPHDTLTPLRADIREIKETLKELAASMVKIAVVEERIAQNVATSAQTRADIAACQVRLTAIELLMVNSTRVTQWVDRSIVGAVVILLMFAASKVGLV